jgi:F-type H+-transporting ATPase subunit alpha
MKKVAGSLKLDMAQYRELQAFAQFGSDLDKATQARLARGERTAEILKQGQFQPMSVEKQVVSIYAVTKGFLDDIPVADVLRFEKELHAFIESNHKDIFDTIVNTKELPPTDKLDSAINEFKKVFVVSE